MLIKINIEKKHPTVDGTPIIVCGNSGYKIQFAFDEEWAGLEFKTARFVYRKAGKAHYIDVPFSGDTVEVPVFCEIGFVWVGVYTDLLQTTTPAKIPCEYSIRCNSGESLEEVTQELYDQMMALFNQVVQEQDTAVEAAQTATQAKEAAQEAAKVAKEAIGSVVSKVVESNAGRYVSFWVGTKEQYNSIEEKAENCMYIITDDTTSEDLLRTVEQMGKACEAAKTAAESAVTGAEKAVEDAEKAAAAAEPVHLVDAAASLNWGSKPGGLVVLNVEGNKFVYAPSVGAVFFEVYIYIRGSINAGESFTLTLWDVPAAVCVTPTNGVPIQCTNKNFVAEVDADILTVRATATVNTDSVGDSVLVHGWYFCNGEG